MKRLRYTEAKSPTQGHPAPLCWVLATAQLGLVSTTGQGRGLRLREVTLLSWGHAAKHQIRDQSRSVCGQGHPLTFTCWRASVWESKLKPWAASFHVLFWVLVFCYQLIGSRCAQIPHPMPHLHLFEANPRCHILHAHIPWYPGSFTIF